MDVVLTGSSGTVGTAVMDHLNGRDDYQFTPVDIHPHADHETVVTDIADYDEIRPIFEGQDALVHLALNTDLSAGVKEVGWFSALEENLKMTCNVLDAALDAGVEAVVLASSNHAVGMYEIDNAPDIYYNQDILIDHTVPVRPDGVYGAVKCFDEALGRFCAEYHNIRVYAIRIGSIMPSGRDHPYARAVAAVSEGRFEPGSDEYQRTVDRVKASWQSRRDFAHMVDCCLSAEEVPFGLFYGISDNDNRWLDIEHARDTIGYDPRDNGDEWTSPPNS